MSKEHFHFELPHDFTEDELDALFIAAQEASVSDLILQSGDFIFAKWRGRWGAVNSRRLEHNEVERIISLKYGASAAAKIDGGVPLDYRHKVVVTRDRVLGFRAHAKRGRVGPIENGLKLIARRIPGLPPKWETLGIEPELSRSLFPQYGLCLVVGTTGSGKSTLMASALRRRLEEFDRAVHIGTFEEPIEFTFEELGLGKMPLVSQVEIGVGADLKDFGLVGRSSMRSAFDVIVAGEMRDIDSVRMGLELAETGHAVMATLHTETPANAIDRIISFFPPNQQPSIASNLRATLRVVVAQKLINTTAGDRMALRSWVVFDREVKRRLSLVEHSKWQMTIEDICMERGTSFEVQAIEPLVSGKLSINDYLEVSGLTLEEAKAFLTARGVWQDRWEAEYVG